MYTHASLAEYRSLTWLKTTEPKGRAFAMSIFLTGPQCGPVLGPVLGGALAEADWRWIFGFLGLLSSLSAFYLLKPLETNTTFAYQPSPGSPSGSSFSSHSLKHSAPALATALSTKAVASSSGHLSCHLL